MDEVLRLATGLPALYFSLLLEPSGYLGIFGALGVVSLFAGVALASFRANRRALLFLIPFALCEAVVVGSALLYGRLPDQVMLVSLLILGMANGLIILWILWPFDGAPGELWLLAFHSLAYGLLASYVANQFAPQAGP